MPSATPRENIDEQRSSAPLMFKESMERSLDFWRHPPRWAYAIVWPWALGFVYFIYSSQHFHQVAARQRVAEGQIVAHEPRNHNQYRFRFTVSGRTYQGWASPRAEPFTVGQRVRVFYDPDNPSTCALTDFGDLSWEILGPVPVLSMAIAGGVAIVFMLRQRSRVQPEN
jgi:hypothetical protein